MGSISASLAPTDWRRLYSSLIAKSASVFINGNYCSRDLNASMLRYRGVYQNSL